MKKDIIKEGSLPSIDITKRLELSGHVEIDIGSGMGRFILARAASHPDTQFIGIERLKPRVAKILRKAEKAGLTNIRMIRLEALYVLRYLIPEHSITRMYLFFPDPWPKRKHSGHRIFNDEFRYLVWTRLKPGGDLQVATDSEAYFADMEAQMAHDKFFRRVAPIKRTEAERTNFELLFQGQGLKTFAAGYSAVDAAEIGANEVTLLHEEDIKRREKFWREEMPHADSVHIIGIGGVGMSAIAQALIDDGNEVTGSDRLVDTGKTTKILEALSHQGVQIFRQDGSGIGMATNRVVTSTAIENDNPDLIEAKRRGLTIEHRSRALERLLEGRKSIAVAGTSGKSTTTALLGWILTEGGLDPTVINGAEIVGWDDEGHRVGSVRRGEGEYCVFEADESDRSFLRFKPEMAIVTNETPDHFSEEETHRLFAEFKLQVKGTVIEGDTDVIESRCDGASPWKTKFKAGGKDWTLALPGRHNCINAWQAVRMAQELGVAETKIRRALLTFPGVCRRLQRIGTTPEGCIVIDDYAHNPAKLEAAIGTVATASNAIAVLWRPHGYAPLRKMLIPLAEMFARNLRSADTLYLLPVYDAGGTADRNINSCDLEEAIKAQNKEVSVITVENMVDAKEKLTKFGKNHGEKGAVLISGARDPALPELAKSLC